MTYSLVDRPRGKTPPTAITPVRPSELDRLVKAMDSRRASWVRTNRFEAREGQVLLVPGPEGTLQSVLLGLGNADTAAPDRLLFGKLPGLLPPATYNVDGQLPDPQTAALAWLLGSYAFDRYHKATCNDCRLVTPAGANGALARRIFDGVSLARDLINTPSNDMGPDELEAAARKLAATHKARVSVVSGEQLLRRNFPMIHAVGRASTRTPRLIDLTWGRPGDRKVTLVGKGVCFDTGGLNLKPGSAMALMKKDMGGAANVLGLASMIMAAGLRLRLRVLLPAVENSVSGNAFRPGDVLVSRKGMTVEIGNTDAEGRLVLADALALADDEAPELLVDMATLTGAARVALGPDLPAVFTDDDALAADVAEHAAAVADPVWRLPFWKPYESMLVSRVADISHISDGPFAGSITAALFLRRFVEKAKSYMHIDLFAWTPAAKSGRPVGGEAQAIRALYALVAERYG